jgi:hypothetical protein
MVKSNSLELYLSSYINLIKQAGSDNLDKIIQYIEGKQIKDRTKHNYLNSIVSIHKHNPSLVKGNIDKVKLLRDNLQKKINEAVKEDNITDKQRVAMDKVNWGDIENLIKKLEDNKGESKGALEEHILLELMNPPMRNDLQEIDIVTKKKDCDGNCIYIPPKGFVTLYIKDHKTTSRGGEPIIRELEKTLSDDVRKLVKDGRKFLFVDRSGKGYTSSAFTHYFKRIFQKHLGVAMSSTILRKIYLTSKYGSYKKKVKEMEQDAVQMGHSVETQQNNYVDSG